MSKAIQVWEQEGIKIKYIEVFGERIFSLNQVAKEFGYSIPVKLKKLIWSNSPDLIITKKSLDLALNGIDESISMEDLFELCDVDKGAYNADSQLSRQTFISEDAVYLVIMRSRKPKAVKIREIALSYIKMFDMDKTTK